MQLRGVTSTLKVHNLLNADSPWQYKISKSYLTHDHYILSYYIIHLTIEETGEEWLSWQIIYQTSFADQPSLSLALSLSLSPSHTHTHKQNQSSACPNQHPTLHSNRPSITPYLVKSQIPNSNSNHSKYLQIFTRHFLMVVSLSTYVW